MNLHKLLEEFPLKEWDIELVTVLDWHDGPREGFCQFRKPDVAVYFEILAERFSPNDPDDQLFIWKQITNEDLSQIYSLLESQGKPNAKIWIPEWEFDSPETQQAVEKAIDDLILKHEKTDLIVRSRDMENFAEYWFAV